MPPTGPLIVASNHLSFMDSMVIPLACRRQVHFLGKAEYFQGTGLRGAAVRWFHSTGGTIPVERSDPRAAAALARAGRGGAAAAARPSASTPRAPARPTAGCTAAAPAWPGWPSSTGATLVPCAVIGTDQVQPPGSNSFRPARVTVRFGAPIDVEGLSARYQKAALLRAITDEVMEAIGSMSGQERSGRYASDVKAELAAHQPSFP